MEFKNYIVVCSDPNGDNPDMYFGPIETLAKAEQIAEDQNNQFYMDPITNESIGCPNEHFVMPLREYVDGNS